MSDIPQYFAQINDKNIVIDLAVVSHLYMEENPDRYPGIWVETFINLPNKTYAAIGFIYDEKTKDFYDPTPPLPDPIEI